MTDCEKYTNDELNELNERIKADKNYIDQDFVKYREACARRYSDKCSSDE